MSANPSVTQFQANLAASHHDVGRLQSDTGRPTEALQSLEQARAICEERLARQNPSVTQFQSDLALCHNNIGLIQSATGRPAAALSRMNRPARSASGSRTTILSLRTSPATLGGTLNNMAVIDLGERQFDRAQTKLTQAVKWQRKAAGEQPESPRLPVVPG